MLSLASPETIPWMKEKMESENFMRKSGVLLPISSLPSRYGIGGFSREAYEFVDRLVKAGQSYWQILPLGPTGYGDSPYQAFSSFAGNPYFISLETLTVEGLLTQEECEAANSEGHPEYVDYGRMYEQRFPVLRKAFSRFRGGGKFRQFVKDNAWWLENYCLFTAIKQDQGGKCWADWPQELKARDPKALQAMTEKLADELEFQRFLQYKFAMQWLRLKSYANKKGIEIIGDIPIYVAFDSADAWGNPDLFQFDENSTPLAVAGCPPDAFTEKGQLWGNPLYRWDYHKKSGYTWWISRVSYSLKLYDVIRVDHFRGFDEYYAVPYGDPTAEFGTWEKGPGMDLFRAIEEKLGKVNIIAEDLGLMTDGVRQLVKDSGYPNMKVLQFAFDPAGNNEYLPHNYGENCVVYTGTHDNNTTLGWYREANPAEREFADRYLGIYNVQDEGAIPWFFIRMAYSSVAKICIIPMQDYLSLGGEARLNFPSSLGTNWQWRMRPLAFSDELVNRMRGLAFLYGRLAEEKPFDAEAWAREFEENEQADSMEELLQEEKTYEEEIGVEVIQLPTEEIHWEPADADVLEKEINDRLRSSCGRDLKGCTKQEVFSVLLSLCKEKLAGRPQIQGNKKLYYISAEFLIGKLLSNNLINLGIYDDVEQILRKYHLHLADLEDIEMEPSLGNGGLGRLAACFLDSIATLGLCGDGVGLNYHYGLFRQQFSGNKQQETKNPWITNDNWLMRQQASFEVPFKYFTAWSTMYDIAVPGYHNGCNRLHLFDLDTVDDTIVGDDSISFDKYDVMKNLTLFLYPDDSDRQGQLLRVYQQYFMVSNAAQLILMECEQRGVNLHHMHHHVVIQINDTHPSMVIPEMIRLLTARGFSMDEAISVVSKTCAYTNHTILAEALEKWPVDYLDEVCPQLLPIIRELDARVKQKYSKEGLAIIDQDNRIHMARMDMHYGFSVNGVAALHTEILKKSELKDFYEIYPEKFNNKTNGITVRRWLASCNPKLADYLQELLDAEIMTETDKLEGLMQYQEDKEVLDKLQSIKSRNKRNLSRYLYETQNLRIDPNSIYDVQVKRLHEYKRQQMNALYAIYKYKEIKAGRLPKTPLTMIFGAKAAPAYTIAKDIIHLLLCLSKLIANDPQVSPYMQLVMVENYNVTKAGHLIPAADISEQISLASKEASGTGNMKFMLNGALTLGTEDGANVEIHELVGDDNIYIFGKMPDDVIRLYDTNGYHAEEYYNNDPQIHELVDFLLGEELTAIGDPVSLNRLHHELSTKDWFMTLLDLKDYITTKEKMLADYEDRDAWMKKVLVNIAKAGFFSADRTIAQYDQDIWKLS